jgi:hypothetical protein
MDLAYPSVSVSNSANPLQGTGRRTAMLPRRGALGSATPQELHCKWEIHANGQMRTWIRVGDRGCASNRRSPAGGNRLFVVSDDAAWARVRVAAGVMQWGGSIERIQ